MAKKAKKAKPNFVRITLSIPRELKERMDMADKRHAVTWSAVAREAFERKLADLNREIEVRTMKDAIERMRALVQDEQGEEYKTGFEAGYAWAKREATPHQLKRIENDKNSQGNFGWENLFRDESVSWEGGAPLVCYRVWIGSDDANSREAELFWVGHFPHVAEPTNEMLLGFAEGALSFWEAVKNHL